MSQRTRRYLNKAVPLVKENDRHEIIGLHQFILIGHIPNDILDFIARSYI